MTDNRTLDGMLEKFMPFAQKRMGFKSAPEIRFESDEANAQDPLGKTAYYEPNNSRITVYTVGRHPKDIMRSISHELVHHTQNGKGAFADSMTVGEQGYAQNDEHLREMEREAYEQGNLCFRDWEDSVKTQHNEELDMWQKRNNKLNESIMKKFGYVNEISSAGLPTRHGDSNELDSGAVKFRQQKMYEEGDALDAVLGRRLAGESEEIIQAARELYWYERWPDDVAEGNELEFALEKFGGEGSFRQDVKLELKYGFIRKEKTGQEDPEGRGDPHSYEPEDMGYNAGTPLVTKENLEGEYDEGYRDRLDQVQAEHPEKTMPEIEAMLSGGGMDQPELEPEMGQPELEPEPVPSSGGEKYEVGDTIKDEDNRTGQVLELTAYGAIVQFEEADGPEKIRFKHMTKSAEDKELARPEWGDETGFDSGAELTEDEELAVLQEEFPEAFQIVVGENEEGGCAEAPIQIVVGEEDDVTVMKQEGALVKESLPLAAAGALAGGSALVQLVDKYAPDINRSNFETVVRKIREFIQEAEDEGLAETEAVKYLSKRYGPIAKFINIGASSVEEAAAKALKNIDKIKAMAGKKIEGAINFLKDIERNTRPKAPAFEMDDLHPMDDPQMTGAGEGGVGQQARDAKLHERLKRWSVK